MASVASTSKALFLVLLTAANCDCVGKTHNQECKVDVATPWQENTYVPQNSSIIYMTCNGERNQDLYWTIQLAGSDTSSDTDIQFDYSPGIILLNDHGIYEIDIETTDSIGLLINNTEGNNGTRIKCTDANTADTVSETTLIVIDSETSSDFDIILFEVIPSLSQINISLKAMIQSALFDTYNLIVTSNVVTKTVKLLSYEPYFEFTAPEDAPPCEVYNFSVTATYVGVTYTGAGCSVPSPVLSTMLPSLPDVKRLNFGTKYTLNKTTESEEKISLTVLLPTNYYCEEYPVFNNTLQIAKIKPMQSFSDIMSRSPNNMEITSAEDDTFTTDLLENAVYSFRVYATNSVGTVHTDNITLYTTDVQKVTVFPIDDRSSIRVQCEFITGSDAQGCLVMLVGERNVTLNITRQQNGSIASETYDTISCLKEVLAFDIEVNGAVGSLAVIGQVYDNASFLESSECPTKSPDNNGNSLTLITVIVTLVLISLLLLIVIIVFVRLFVKRFRANISNVVNKRKSQSQDISLASTLDNSISQEIIDPLYDLPQRINKKPNVVKKTTDNYNKTSHRALMEQFDVPESNSAAYAQLQQEEHMYHVLESTAQESVSNRWENILPDPDAPELPSPYRPDDSDDDNKVPLFYYHEIDELSRRKSKDN